MFEKVLITPLEKTPKFISTFCINFAFISTFVAYEYINFLLGIFHNRE